LPAALSELLASAVAGAPGIDTPAAFANALSTLEPQLIAGQDEVRAELERLMGPERARRREQLELLQARPAGRNGPGVFRAPPAPALPDVARPPKSSRPLAPEVVRRASASTLPPPKPAAAGSQPTHPTPTIPAPPLTPPPVADPADSPISGVWREASAKLGTPGRQVRPKPAALALEPTAPAPTVPATRTPKRFKAYLVVALVLAATSALVATTWLGYGASSGSPGAPQQLP
ncbi:MAG TPA: hypothetical protein VFK05_21775, partial [Polyangiaceae bacterium]|nr:hypothetical protein [Polyangiaceae bacterium]